MRAPVVRFAVTDADARAAAHALVLEAAAEWLGVAARDLALTHRCPDCDSDEHGVPLVAGRLEVHVSLSHTRGWIAAMAAGGRCGIDVEEVRPLGDSVLRRFLSDAEQAWLAAQPDRVAAGVRVWARKEARFKAGQATSVVEADGLDTRGLEEWAGTSGDGTAFALGAAVRP
ncbi:MAG: 4'-phosphopantetheinyl transferase superfamily protein [Nocardioides sp.]|uniref:4'-phosphopantetheinyl transferase family protein n=1 Tax=Nocardioides sp. TaxID=35761 RepID=UPI0039E4256F